jgi:selenocysteine-specific elongation factor
MPQELWRAFLERAAASGSLRLDGDRVARAGHEIRLSAEDLEAARRIEMRFLEAALDPPDTPDVLAVEGGARAARIVDLLVGQGRLVRIRDGRYFHRDALAQLRSKLGRRARTAPLIDVAAFKELAGVTRKNAIPLLEQLDAERVTRRVGNSREILVREPSGD